MDNKIIMDIITLVDHTAKVRSSLETDAVLFYVKGKMESVCAV